jgi:hypothetical protein
MNLVVKDGPFSRAFRHHFKINIFFLRSCTLEDLNLYGQYIRNPVRTGIVVLTRIIFFTINVMRQMFMRQILADAISVLFQKITRQMLCDKCSRNDVTLTLKMLTSYGGKNTLDPQNADVIWREIYPRRGLSNYCQCYTAPFSDLKKLF